MTKPTTKPAQTSNLLAVAACSMQLDGGSEIQLTPAGEFRARDGRPANAPCWRIDAALAQNLIDACAARGTPYVIDYEHQTLHAATNGQPAPASGWFSQLEWREGSGLFAVGVEWTAAASAMIAAKEYRYISPVITYAPDGAVTGLLMAAITNNPAIDGMDGVLLAAATRQFAALTLLPTQEPHMDKILALLRTLLNLPADAGEAAILAKLETLSGKVKEDPVMAAAASIDLVDLVSNQRTQIAALGAATPDPAQYVPMAALQQLQQHVAQLNSAANVDRIEAAVQAALTAGQLVPSLAPWARDLGKKDFAALTSFIAGAPPLAALNMQSKQVEKTQAEKALTPNQIALCAALGQDAKEFQAALHAEQLG